MTAASGGGGCGRQHEFLGNQAMRPALMLVLDPIGLRVGSAVTGLLLVLFLLVHLAGLIPAVIAPRLFERYASSLHHNPLLPLLEMGLAITALLHISLTLIKTIRNRRCGNTAALISSRESPLTALANRSALLAGVLTLVFLGIHLLQLRWPRPADGHEHAVLVGVLHNPLSTGLYSAAALAMGLHLLHGTEAAHRGMGWLTPFNASVIRRGGQLLAAGVSTGFLLVCLALALGTP